MRLNVGRGGVPSLFFISMFFSVFFYFILCCIGGITIIDHICVCTLQFSIVKETISNYVIRRVAEKKAFDVITIASLN